MAAGRLTSTQRKIRAHLLKAENFQATTGQLAEELGLSAKSVSQSLSAMQIKQLVLPVKGEGTDTVWQWKTFLDVSRLPTKRQ